MTRYLFIAAALPVFFTAVCQGAPDSPAPSASAPPLVGHKAPDGEKPWADATAVRYREPIKLSQIWEKKVLVLLFFPMAWSPG